MPSSSAAVFARRRASTALAPTSIRDAGAAQLVGDRDGQVGRHDRLLDPPPLDGAQDDLELRLVALDAVGEHLVEAELVEQDELGVGQRVSAMRADSSELVRIEVRPFSTATSSGSMISSGTSCRMAG